MANRAYLFATDLIPAPGMDPAAARIIGISEWKYDIPLAFKTLLTGDPQTCPSLIWKSADNIAIVADFQAGVTRLLSELQTLADPRLRTLRTEAAAFLTAPANQRKFFLLEAGDIFDMNSEDDALQNQQLLLRIQELSRAATLPWPTKTMTVAPKVSLLDRLLGRAQPAPPAPLDIDKFGLDNWSDTVAFDFNSP